MPQEAAFVPEDMSGRCRRRGLAVLLVPDPAAERSQTSSLTESTGFLLVEASMSSPRRMGHSASSPGSTTSPLRDDFELALTRRRSRGTAGTGDMPWFQVMKVANGGRSPTPD